MSLVSCESLAAGLWGEAGPGALPCTASCALRLVEASMGDSVSEQHFSPALRALYREGSHLWRRITDFFQTTGERRETSFRNGLSTWPLPPPPGVEVLGAGRQRPTFSRKDPSGQANVMLRDCAVLPPHQDHIVLCWLQVEVTSNKR